MLQGTIGATNKAVTTKTMTSHLLFRLHRLLQLLRIVILQCPVGALAQSITTVSLSRADSTLDMNNKYVGQRERQQSYAPISYNFAMVVKSMDNPFFDPARDGCMEQAAALTQQRRLRGYKVTVECIFVGPPSDVGDFDGTQQAALIRSLIYRANESIPEIHGLAVSVRQTATVAPALYEAMAMGIPVVTFDSDVGSEVDVNTHRAAYVGTDNIFFGRQLAKMVKTLQPNGGTFATLTFSSPNIQQRLVGFYEGLATIERKGAVWTELPGSPADFQGNTTLAMEKMEEFAVLNPTAIVSVMGAPMRSGDLWINFARRHILGQNLTVVCGDAMPTQLDYMARRFVHGLLGQLPFEMGQLSISLLFELAQQTPSATRPTYQVEKEILGTNVLAHILIPLELPPLKVDNNLIGPLRIIGFLFYATIILAVLFFGGWAFLWRHDKVVKLAQPVFLLMVAFGVLILGSPLVPLSFDDHGIEQDGRNATLKCMSVPWMAFFGFTVVFTALFSKTRRVNRIFHSRAPYRRIQVSAKEIFMPLVILLATNTTILTCWTIFDPLRYVRLNHVGLDGWNRVVSTYGICRSEQGQSIWFIVPLAVVNVSVLLMANWQAYEARSIQEEFSEAKYIAMTMGSMLQVVAVGIPVLLLVEDAPQAFYLCLTTMLFLVCMAVLCLIFVPKMVLAADFHRRSSLEQRKLIMEAIKRQSRLAATSDPSIRLWGFGSSFMEFSASSHLMGASSGVYLRSHTIAEATAAAATATAAAIDSDEGRTCLDDGEGTSSARESDEKIVRRRAVCLPNKDELQRNASEDAPKSSRREIGASSRSNQL